MSGDLQVWCAFSKQQGRSDWLAGRSPAEQVVVIELGTLRWCVAHSGHDGATLKIDRYCGREVLAKLQTVVEHRGRVRQLPGKFVR